MVASWQSIFAMPQLLIVMIFLIPIAAIGFHYWYKTRKAESENELKQSMVQRGMSADEIERVMATRTHHS